MNEKRQYFTIPAFAEKSGISKDRLWRMCRNRLLQHEKRGSKYLIPGDALSDIKQMEQGVYYL